MFSVAVTGIAPAAVKVLSDIENSMERRMEAFEVT